MRIGRFNQKITFQRYTTTSDNAGGLIQTYVDDIICFANITPLNSDEVFQSAQQSDNNYYKIMVRYTNDFNRPLDKQYRIKWGSKILNIVRLINTRIDDRFYEIHAYEK